MHHNTIDNIVKSEGILFENMMKNGMLIINLLSAKSDGYKTGREIEKNIFILNEGPDSGIPHHYFDEKEIRFVFKKWKLLILAEQVVNYIEKEFEFYKTNPYPYTKWLLLLQK